MKLWLALERFLCLPDPSPLSANRMSQGPFATFYDPASPNEQPVALPSAPLVSLSQSEVLQPPLTRRGTGPGIILILPHFEDLNLRMAGPKPLDPEPIQKWAEEGFTVAGVTPSSPDWSSEQSLKKATDALLGLKELDTHDKFAVVGTPDHRFHRFNRLSLDV
ncbi:hypothetical protein DXG03_005283 [Asterophora parasitica]|uniref:Uncharacterized protein n=1 Tax=Asterophora parasitica TaxID=117018 RepID=A0A9P7KBH1_9AGAR|nr:hypothetical protein DXG03_005283 [Asterophora parasitica]